MSEGKEKKRKLTSDGDAAEAEALHARAARMVREGGELWLETEVMRIGALAARDAGEGRREEAEAMLRDAAARARKREMPVFELWCLLDLSRTLGPVRPDPAVAARIGELSHLRDLERRVAEATSREEGKPEAALPKIVEGRVNGFFKEVTLLDQPFAKDNKKTVKALLDEAGVTVTGFVRFEVGQA